MITYQEKPFKEEEIFKILNPTIKEWFTKKFKNFSEPQKYAIPLIHNQKNVLVSSPTGSGKTLTAFLSILNELTNLSQGNFLENKVYCIYISPLKALSNDISINLIQPLKEIEAISKQKLNIKVGVRTSDTTASEKSQMLKHAPHILICTPESFAIAITSIKFRELLKDVKYLIVDEVHALAENKRGVHLNLSIERLRYFANNKPVTIGLSATISPLDEIAKFLVGEDDCKIIDVQFLKKMDLKVMCPVDDLINISYDDMHSKLYTLIDSLIQDHKTTLIFTNTRAATERVVHHLKEKYPKKYTENIGAHHGSLSKELRLNLEERLRKGELKVVVTSTSLELGIDIGYIYLVILLGSPKSASRALQRCLPYESKLLLSDGTYKEIGEIVENKLDIEILSFDKEKGFIKNKIAEYHKNNNKELIEIKLHSGSKIRCTEEHPLFTKEGWKKTSELEEDEEVAEIFDLSIDQTPYIYEVINQKGFYVENKQDFLRNVVDQHVKSSNITYTNLAKNIGIRENHLQNYMRKNGRRKSIRLDLFLKIMEICKINKINYLTYLSELKSKSHHRVPISLKVDKDFMWLTGVVATDGSITKNKKTGELKIKIGNKDKKLLEECQKILNKFGFYPKILTTKDNFMTLDCGSKLLAEIMLSFGIKTKNKSHEVEISNNLYKLPKELIIPFIEGVIEGDGSVNSNSIRIFTSSKKFAMGLHNLLNRVGIHNYFNEQRAKISKLIQKINYDTIYCIYISRQKHILNFVNNCTLKGKKSIFLSKIIPAYLKNDKDIDLNLSWTKIESINYIKEEGYVYNITLKEEPNSFFVESILTHNCGRAGHKLHETAKGRIIVLDRDDLIECSVILKSSLDRKIDRIHIPRNCLDVLAQQIVGITCIDRINIDNLFALIKRCYCYKTLEKKDFMDVINYLTGEYTTLEDRNVYAKVWFDPETKMLGRKGKMTRVIYMTNIGTIPDESNILVKLGEQVIGTIDESFLERLKPGDVFVLGGQTYIYRYAKGQTAQVVVSVDRPPTVPSWFSEMLPLSFDLALEIGRFRKLMEGKFNAKRSKEDILKFINEYLYVDKNAGEAVYSYFREQYLFCNEVPSNTKIIIEHYNNNEDEKKIIVHSLYGRRVNDCFSRALAFAVSRIYHKDIEMGISDNGFYINAESKINIIEALKAIKSKEINEVLNKAIEKSEILKRRFRHCAVRSLMILKEYKGKKKRVGRQQVSSMLLISAIRRISEDFPILKEAKREVLEDLMDIQNLKLIIEEIEKGKIEIKEVQTQIPSPFAFNLVLQGYTDILKFEDRMKFLRNMHQLVLAKINLKK